MQNYIQSLEMGVDLQNLTENEIYEAYGFLWSFCYINELTSLENIASFMYKSHKNVSDFLGEYGYCNQLKKIMNKMF